MAGVTALSAYATINHYKALDQRDKDLRSYVRLFLVRVLHYEGGPGPDKADWIKFITDWVKKMKPLNV